MDNPNQFAQEQQYLADEQKDGIRELMEFCNMEAAAFLIAEAA